MSPTNIAEQMINPVVTETDADEASVIPSRLAITAMRDSGYKNTAYALAELIDNSQQAKAKKIEVFCLEKREVVQARERRRLSKIAVLDDGEGMDILTLRKSLQFGNGTRLGDRSGIGRFGMGLPNASISQAARVDVWSWRNGPDNALHTYIDVREIEENRMQMVPIPSHSPVPEEWRELSNEIGLTGTLVVWSDLDINRLTWKSAKSTLQNAEKIVGRVYRRFIISNALSIRLFAKEEGNGVVFDKEAVFDDPLYLSPSPLMPAPFNQKPMFDKAFDDDCEIVYEGKSYNVKMRFSVATSDTVQEAGNKKRGDTFYGKLARNNIGVSVVRADRELMLDPGWCIGYDPRERWWGAEVEFPPALDELFGVTNNKQAATHFSELATIEWTQLADEGEVFMDVVERLKADGDPRGWLLTLSETIKRNIKQLRETIKAQGEGLGVSRKNRHEEPDEVTSVVNERWKERSKEQPIAGEDEPTTETDLESIRVDLTDNKGYSAEDVDALIKLIKDSDLKVFFSKADFPDPYQLFNVDIKGNVTEIVFNRKHPAFDDTFGTINTVDEDFDDLSALELKERLMRAINAFKIIFAAWARYEREAGIDRSKALQRVRFEWGQIAAKFLDPEDDLVL